MGVSYYDKIIHKREVCYLGSGDVMQLSTQINHIEDELGKRPVSRQMHG